MLRCFNTLALENNSLNRKVLLLLISYLCIEGKQKRSYLASLFWPTTETKKQKSNLQESLRKLRKAIPQHLIEENNELSVNLNSDVTAFKEAYENKSYEEALKHYQGPFLDGVKLHKKFTLGVELEEWMIEQKEKYAALALEAKLKLAEQNANQENYEKASQLAYQAFLQDKKTSYPTPEDYQRIHTLMLTASHPHTKEVKQEAQKIYDSFPIQFLNKQAQAKQKLQSNYQAPAPQTKLIGRQEQLKNLTETLKQHKLISLCAAAGTGKTTLALHLAQQQKQQNNYPDGIYFINLQELEPCSEESFISFVTQDLGIESNDLRNLISSLKTRTSLIIFDNFEVHLNHAKVLEDLSTNCPNLSLVITTREPLTINSETVVKLDNLNTQSDPNTPSEAAELYIETTKQQSTPQTTQLINSICQDLGGLPLAIKLVAAWHTSLSLNAIKESLNKDLSLIDQQSNTLKQSYELSYQQLKQNQQQTLTNLSIFSSFDLNAAQEVVNSNKETLKTLVDKNLITFNPKQNSYSFHPIIQRYSQEKQSNQEIHNRHANYYLKLLKTTFTENKNLNQLNTHKQELFKAWRYKLATQNLNDLTNHIHHLERFCDETNNNTSCIELLEQSLKNSNNPEAKSSFLASLAWLQFRQGNYKNVIKLAGQSLNQTKKNPHNLSRCYIAFGAAYDNLGYFKRAKQFFEKDLKLHNDPENQANAHTNLAQINLQLGNYQEAKTNLNQAKKHLEEKQNKIKLNWLEYASAEWFIEQGQIDYAKVQLLNLINSAKQEGYTRLAVLAELRFIKANMENPEECLDLIDKITKPVENLSDTWCHAELRTLKARALFALGLNQIALTEIQEGLQRVQRLGSIPSMLYRLGIALEILKDLNETKAAKLHDFLKQAKNQNRMSFVDQQLFKHLNQNNQHSDPSWLNYDVHQVCLLVSQKEGVSVKLTP